jgi:hypothetical protein
MKISFISYRRRLWVGHLRAMARGNASASLPDANNDVLQIASNHFMPAFACA